MLLMTACKGKNEAPKQGFGLEPQMTVSVFDTTTVQQYTKEFLDLVMHEQIDDAISRLYELDGDQVKPLPDEQKAACRFWLNTYNIYGYRITDFTFYKETDSEVKAELFIEDPATKEDPARISLTFRPVRHNGAWFLRLANSGTQEKSELHN